MSDRKNEILSFNDTVVEVSSLLELDTQALTQVLGGRQASCPSLVECHCYGAYEGCTTRDII